MGKSQETQQLAVEMSGKWGLGDTAPMMTFSLEEGAVPKDRSVGSWANYT